MCIVEPARGPSTNKAAGSYQMGNIVLFEVQLDGPPRAHAQKSIFQPTERATKNPRPPPESSCQGASIGGSIFSLHHFWGC